MPGRSAVVGSKNAAPRGGHEESIRMPCDLERALRVRTFERPRDLRSNGGLRKGGNCKRYVEGEEVPDR